jgi:phage baseplate assembly protein W
MAGETRDLDYPFRVDRTGRVATTDADDHLRDMIHQVLFTNPGERVNRPDFGCGLLQLVFMPNSDALAAATQFTVQGALQRWLGDIIQVERVEVTAEESRLQVSVSYRRLGEDTPRLAEFTTPARPGEGGASG